MSSEQLRQNLENRRWRLDELVRDEPLVSQIINDTVERGYTSCSLLQRKFKLDHPTAFMVWEVFKHLPRPIYSEKREYKKTGMHSKRKTRYD